jgi:O-6-methylguanine DNA methyltransferase
MYFTYADTQAGPILLTSDGQTLSGLYWKVFRRAPLPQAHWTKRPEVFTSVMQQLNEYFAGQRTVFDVAYAPRGTEFQREVWQQLEQLPFGAATSYQAIATAIGRPKAVRAVGTAVGSNPISILIPCHRVLGSSRTLNGYAGGIPAKQALLELENISFIAPAVGAGASRDNLAG